MRSHRFAMLCVLSVFVPAVACAQNFLANGDFDSNGSGWLPNGAGTSTYDPSAGSPAVGSMLLSINDPSGNGVTQAVQQCVAADSGMPYAFSGRTLLDTTASTSAGAGGFLVGQFFVSGNCSGVPAMSSIAATNGTASGTPAAFTTMSIALTSPAGAHSFRLTAQVQTGGPGIAQGWVDHLGLSSTEVIFTNGFE
jgi:hypothetical protein